jgi:excisionase family DNA binding protein
MGRTRTARLLTPAQVGELWGVSEMTVRRWISSGRLPSVDIAPPGCRKPRTRVRENDLLDLVDQLAGSPASRGRRSSIARPTAPLRQA